MSTLASLNKLTPEDAAEQVFAAHKTQREWLDEFSASLDRRRAGQSLARTLTVWDVSQSEAARLFGVSRQALSKWLAQGAPAERAQAIADLAAATDLLVRYLKRDRIPAVVRRPVSAANADSLVDLLGQGRTPELLALCRTMFSFDQAHR